MDKMARRRFPRRVLAAGLTSLLAVPLFFVPVPLFVFIEIREPFATVAMYGCAIGLSGVVSLLINRHWLGETWLATGAAMIGPYLVVGGLPVSLGLVYLVLAGRQDRFIVGLFVLPLLGVIGPVLVAGALSLIAVAAHRRTSKTIRL